MASTTGGSKLKAVKPTETKPSKLKMVIFGKAGEGKTWTALDFKGVYYIDVEAGADLADYINKLDRSGGVYFGKDQGSQSLDEVFEQVKALATEKHSYGTLVIDSLSKLMTLEYDNARREYIAKHKKEPEFAAERKGPNAKLNELLNWMCFRLDMNVIIIAHEKEEYVGGVAIGQKPDLPDKVLHDLNLGLRIVKRGAERVAIVKKSRYPRQFTDGQSYPWNYEFFADKYGRDNLERATEAFICATDEQVKRIDELRKQIPGDTDEKWSKWLNGQGATSWSEISETTAQEMIQKLETKVKEHLKSINLN